jgi:hypothetical protein
MATDETPVADKTTGHRVSNIDAVMAEINRLRTALERLLGRPIRWDETLDQTADSVNAYVDARDQKATSNSNTGCTCGSDTPYVIGPDHADNCPMLMRCSGPWVWQQ